MVDGDIEHEFECELDLVYFQVWGSMDLSDQTDFNCKVRGMQLSNHTPRYLAFGPAILWILKERAPHKGEAESPAPDKR